MITQREFEQLLIRNLIIPACAIDDAEHYDGEDMLVRVHAAYAELTAGQEHPKAVCGECKGYGKYADLECPNCRGTGVESGKIDEWNLPKCDHGFPRPHWGGRPNDCWKCECEEWREEGRLEILCKNLKGPMTWENWKVCRTSEEGKPTYSLSRDCYRRATDAEMATPPRQQDAESKPVCAKCGKETNGDEVCGRPSCPDCVKAWGKSPLQCDDWLASFSKPLPASDKPRCAKCGKEVIIPATMEEGTTLCKTCHLAWISRGGFGILRFKDWLAAKPLPGPTEKAKLVDCDDCQLITSKELLDKYGKIESRLAALESWRKTDEQLVDAIIAQRNKEKGTG